MPILAARRLGAGALCFVLLLTCARVSAAEAPAEAQAPASATTVAAPAVAPVVVDGRVLMSLRGVSARPAEERAADVAARIQALATTAGFDASSLRIVGVQDRTNVMAGDTLVLSVLDADAAVEGMADRQVLAEVYRDRIAGAIERYRGERRPGSLAAQSGIAAVVVAAALLLLGALRWLLGRAATVVRRWFAHRRGDASTPSFSAFTAAELERALDGFAGALYWLLAAVVVFAAIEAVLSLFPWTRFMARELTQLVVQPLRTMWHATVAALPGLAFIAVLVVVVRYLLRLLQLLFGGIAGGSIRVRNFAPEWTWPTYRLVRVAVIAFAVVVAYPYIPGSGSDAFKGISIFLGLLMSLGAASAVANSLAGYLLIYRRTFKVGDRIRVGDMVGDVVEVRPQVALLETVKHEVVTIPSATMLSSQVVNYSARSRTKGLILHIDVGAGFDTPWRQVEAMLLLAASRTDGIERDPAPFVLVTTLGDFYAGYQLNVYCRDPQSMERIYSLLHRNVMDVFNEFEVSLLSPAYQADPEVPKLVPRDSWYLAPAKAPSTSAKPR